MINKLSSVYAVNANGELLATNGTGDDAQVGVATLHNFPVDSSNRLVIAGLNKGRLQPEQSADPLLNGELVIEATNNTTLTFKLQGDDGVIRTGTITLSDNNF
jgi:hypothetical protein